MRKIGKFQAFSPWRLLVVYVGMAVLCSLVVSNGAALAAFGIWGTALRDSVAGLLFVQFFSSAGGFLLPALLLNYALKSQTPDFLHLKKGFHLSGFEVALCAYVLLMPLVSGLSDWAETWHWDESSIGLLRWFHSRSAEAEALTGRLLQVRGGMFGWVLLVVGLSAGIFEEFFFRGGIQGLLVKCLRNRHAAVWVGAALFSLVHLDPYGFLPRWILGAFLGYTYLYSGSLWLPVLLHTLNNLYAAWAEHAGVAESADFVGALSPLPRVLVITVCTLLAVALLLHFHKLERLCVNRRAA